MTIKINFQDEEISQAIQQHLDGGVSIQKYIRAALQYFDRMLIAENNGSMCGFGDKSRFKSYNTEVSPKDTISQL